MKKHVVVFSPDVAEKILSGKKKIEILLSVSKSAPFKDVSSRDIVYLKLKGKDIIGQFTIAKAIFYDGITADDLIKIQKDYGKDAALNTVFWEEKRDAKYATLIFIDQSSRFITSPIRLTRKERGNWIVLEKDS